MCYSVKSKNINQDDIDQKLKLITMEYLKNNNNYEISLIFTNNAYITLSTEIIEVTLDDQSKVDWEMIKILDSKIKNFDTVFDKLLSKRKKKVQLNSVFVTKIIKDVKKTVIKLF